MLPPFSSGQAARNGRPLFLRRFGHAPIPALTGVVTSLPFRSCAPGLPFRCGSAIRGGSLAGRLDSRSGSA